MKTLTLLLTFVLCLLLTALNSCSTAPKDFNIMEFGAVNDSTVLSTVAVQKAIDACSKNGSGRVVIPEGNFQIGTINLKSNVELHLEHGSQLLGSLSLADYSTTNIGAIEAPAFNKTLIYAHNQKNIKITGTGIINGRGSRKNFPIKIDRTTLGERPMLIRFIDCRNTQFSDVTLKHSASWCCHLVDCDDTIIKGVKIDSHVNRNNDGFDIDGCKNMLIEDCDIFSGDDALCPKSTTTRITENIVIRNCRAFSNTSGFKLGTSGRGGFRNILVEDCDFSDSRMGAIKLLLVDGGIMEDIVINNIKMDNVEGPIFIRLANRGRDYLNPTEQTQNKDAQPEGIPVGSIKGIKISNIKATVVSDIPKRCGIMISGIPNHLIQDVTLENIDISFPGGVKHGEFSLDVDEDIARYPEQFFFGVLPSWGAYVRHAENVTFNNVKLSVRESDDRERLVLVDAINFVEK